MILVTGATGTTGSVVLKELLDRGAPVRALTHSPEKADELRALGADVAIGDLSDPGSLDDAVRGVERMYLVQSPGPDQAAQEINAISAAERAGAYAVVKLGFLGQDAQSPVRFVRVHAEVTEHLQQSSLRWTILQCARVHAELPGHGRRDPRGQARLVQARRAHPARRRARRRGGRRAGARRGGPRELHVRPDGPGGDHRPRHRRGARRRSSRSPTTTCAARSPRPATRSGTSTGFVELDDAYRSGAIAGARADVVALLGRKARSFAHFADDHRAIFGRLKRPTR